MTANPVLPRAKARADVDFPVEYHANEAEVDVAFSVTDAPEQAYTFIGQIPAARSPRWSHALGLPGLRAILLKGSPSLAFSLEFQTHVDVWRVLHIMHDMPAWQTDADDKR